MTPKDDLFPSRLKAARELRQLSQQALAEAAALPSTSISHFEGGTRKPSFDNLKRLADSLRVSADYLLGRVDAPEEVGTPDTLARHAAKLTQENLQLAEAFLDLLAKKDEEKRKS
jgi:transcriptional regulator with XRE-family HTH domain